MTDWRHRLSEIAMGAEEEAAVLRVIRSRWLSMGPETEALEREFAEFLGMPGACAVSNGTAALHLALLAHGIGPGDEVIVPALSFVATANAVLYVGAKPVFADIESLERPLLDPADVERKLTSRTRAVIVMHYGGNPCAMDRFRELCAPTGIRLIEDAAHCAGSRFDAEKCGTIGDAGCFSLFGNKNLPAGEGGFVVARDPEALRSMTLMRSHGMTTLSWERSRGHSSGYDVVGLGYNYRMPELSSAVARAQLLKLSAHNRKRDEIFDLYVRSLADVPGIHIPFAETVGKSPGSRHLFTLVLDDPALRPALVEALRAEGIQSSLHYLPIPSFALYRSKNERVPGLTRQYSERAVTLPFHPLLGDAGVAEICDVIRRFFRN